MASLRRQSYTLGRRAGATGNGDADGGGGRGERRRSVASVGATGTDPLLRPMAPPDPPQPQPQPHPQPQPRRQPSDRRQSAAALHRRSAAREGAGASGKGGGGVGEPDPPDPHKALAEADWPGLHRSLIRLAQDGALTAAAGRSGPSGPGEDEPKAPLLHTMVWKAPPALAVALIRFLSGAGEPGAALTARDQDDNTALHLCCANLGGGGDADVSVTEALLRASPDAIRMQNAQGDSPLHMLVSSAACAPVAVRPDDPRYAAIGASARLVVDLLLGTRGSAEAALLQDASGATPLHVALASGAHGSVVDALVDFAPRAMEAADARGMLPLHYAAAYCRTPVSCVQEMLRQYPGALMAQTSSGDVPLHLLVSNSAANAANDAELSENTRGITAALLGPVAPADGAASRPLGATNREKLTPLHCCALFDAPLRLTKILMAHPDSGPSSVITNSFGATALHLASAQPGVTKSIATVLAIGTEDAAAVKDRLKRTPLHVAAQNVHATDRLVKGLALLYPGATAERTQRGHLPLHLAAQSQAKEEVVRALIKAHPAAAEARNRSGNTPLHDAAKYRASAGVVRLLLAAQPDAVKAQNQYGNLPLHCATAYQASPDVTRFLLEAWPDGAGTQNRNSDCPLHYASAYATTVPAIMPLIDAMPSSVLMVNDSGQTCVDRAKASQAPEEIVNLLEDTARKVQADRGA